MSITYQQAGVNIDTGNQVVDYLKENVSTTFSAHVLKGVGSFGSFFDLTNIINHYQEPVMVQSMDGVGTKTIVAQMANNYSQLGSDLLSACCNDIVVHGATPLTFLDYLASARLDAEVLKEILKGLIQACRENHVSLVGGETAEMPGVYLPQENDIVGIVTGIVEKSKIIDGKDVVPGDVLVGIPSSGLHTNGYSLARKILFSMVDLQIDTFVSELNESLGKALLKPHVNYTLPVLSMLKSNIKIKAMAHITGGGFYENIPRVFPKNCKAIIQKGSWPILPIFKLIQRLGDVTDTEMFRTFNMGIGLVMICQKSEATRISQFLLEHFDLDTYMIGKIVEGESSVELIEG